MKLLILLVIVSSACAFESRITGGHDAQPGQFPYQIAVADRSHFHHCGGAIIAPRYIVTAALCIFEHHYPLGIHVKAGSIYAEEVGTDYQYIPIAYYDINYKVGSDPGPYDIALLVLSEALVYNEFVQPIKLPVKGSTPYGQAVISSWGQRENEEMPNTLQYADVTLMPFYDCYKALEPLWNGTVPLALSNLCTEPWSSGVTICKDDKGSPLVQDDILIGVVSWRVEPCYIEDAPAVYTSISHHIDWIYEHVDNWEA